MQKYIMSRFESAPLDPRCPMKRNQKEGPTQAGPSLSRIVNYLIYITVPNFIAELIMISV